MAESFNAKYCCVKCLITRDVLAKTVDINHIERRRHYNFYDCLEETSEGDSNFLTQTQGIYRKSQLCRLKYLKIPESIGMDVFHDGDEGLFKDCLNEFIDALIQTRHISMEEVVDRVKNFNYGALDHQYRPSQLKHMSGLQVRNLAYRTNFIFEDFRGILNPEYFKVMSLISKIMQFAYSDQLSDRHISYLDQFVKEILQIVVSVFKKPIKPKYHNFTHYEKTIRDLGPLALMETSPFERKHRIFTRVMEKNPQFTNILKSCADRHQLWWSQTWAETKCFHATEVKGVSKKKLSMKNVVFCSPAVNLSAPVFVVKCATCVFDYKEGLYVAGKHRDGYIFYKIMEVIILNSKIFLKCNIVQTKYDSFFSAHKILNVENNYAILSVEELDFKEPLTEINPFKSSEKFILSKRNII